MLKMQSEKKRDDDTILSPLFDHEGCVPSSIDEHEFGQWYRLRVWLTTMKVIDRAI
jgi:hypothetical protein